MNIQNTTQNIFFKCDPSLYSISNCFNLSPCFASSVKRKVIVEMDLIICQNAEGQQHDDNNISQGIHPPKQSKLYIPKKLSNAKCFGPL